MAMMDDYQFLIAHIRNSFITSDNTGMYEMIIEGEQPRDPPPAHDNKRPLWPGTTDTGTSDRRHGGSSGSGGSSSGGGSRIGGGGGGSSSSGGGDRRTLLSALPLSSTYSAAAANTNNTTTTTVTPAAANTTTTTTAAAISAASSSSAAASASLLLLSSSSASTPAPTTPAAAAAPPPPSSSSSTTVNNTTTTMAVNNNAAATAAAGRRYIHSGRGGGGEGVEGGGGVGSLATVANTTNTTTASTSSLLKDTVDGSVGGGVGDGQHGNDYYGVDYYYDDREIDRHHQRRQQHHHDGNDDDHQYHRRHRGGDYYEYYDNDDHHNDRHHDNDDDLCRSYDILPDMDYGAHRRRSNTAQRLERMKKEKRKQVKVTHISWRTTTATNTTTTGPKGGCHNNAQTGTNTNNKGACPNNTTHHHHHHHCQHQHHHHQASVVPTNAATTTTVAVYNNHHQQHHHHHHPHNATAVSPQHHHHHHINNNNVVVDTGNAHPSSSAPTTTPTTTTTTPGTTNTNDNNQNHHHTNHQRSPHCCCSGGSGGGDDEDVNLRLCEYHQQQQQQQHHRPNNDTTSGGSSSNNSCCCCCCCCCCGRGGGCTSCNDDAEHRRGVVNNDEAGNNDDYDDMFTKKVLPLPPWRSGGGGGINGSGVDGVVGTNRRPMSSLLSQQLQTSEGVMSNPFLDYAKYDGKAQIVVPTKKIDIYLTMALAKDRPFPMHVVVVVNAKVHELIGLICWQYTNEGRDPALKSDPCMYSLHIAEDDGEVDMDFPSLDNREPVSKFGFGKLALVELEEPAPPMKSSVIITVNVPNRGFHKFQEEDLTKPLRDILTRVLKKRKIKLLPGMNYVLEKQKEPGVSVDLDTLLSNLDNHDFCLVREHSTRGEVEDIDFQESQDMATTFMSPQYKSYIVNLVQRLRINTEVHLGVSGEKVEIDPVASKGTALFFRQKAVTYEADMVAACDLIDEKSSGKSIFRLTCFAGHDYRHYDFEADHAVAKEIIQKVNNILNLLLSQVRKTYLASKGKKLKKMHSK